MDSRQITIHVIGPRFLRNRIRKKKRTKKTKWFKMTVMTEANEEKSKKSVFEQFNINIFDDVYGYAKIKQYIELAFYSLDPVHILFVGPPACAKSMFLLLIEEFIQDSRLILGSNVTKAGPKKEE